MCPSPSELPRLVGLAGYMGVGKSTVASIMEADYGYRVYGFADALKALARKIGWDGTKRPPSHYYERLGFGAHTYNGRLLLQELGVGAREVLGEDVWVKALFERIAAEAPPLAVISDLRFENEADAIRARGGVVVRIEREGYHGDGHLSERAIPSPDAVVVNHAGTAALRKDVAEVLRSLPVP